MHIKLPYCIRLFALTALLLAGLLLSGCSSSSDPEPEQEAKELGVKSDGSPNAPELTLLEEGKRLYESGLFTVARDQFESLRSNYPLSPYLEFAELKIADSYFHSGDFASAATSYEEFNKSHPSSSSSNYALLMAGRSQQLSNQGIGRDTAPLEKAMALYNEVIRLYPQSVYAISAAQYKHEVERDLRAHDQLLLDYYKKRDNTLAFQQRETELKTRWANFNPEAQAAAGSTLASLAPSTSFGAPLPPAAKSKLNKAVTESGKSSLASMPTPHSDLIQSVECKNTPEKLVTLFLNSASGLIDNNLKTSSSDQGLNLQLPKANGSELQISCFASKDLTVRSNGTLRLQGIEQAQVISLLNPPRILIIPAEN